MTDPEGKIDTDLSALTEPAQETVLAAAEREFLDASIAVWREIDRLDSRPEGYHPTRMDVELRKRERRAWESYRDQLDLAPDEPAA